MITSSRHDKERKKTRNKILGVILGIVLIMLFFRSPVYDISAGVFQYLGKPLFVVQHFFGDAIVNYQYTLTTKRALLEENTRLKDTLDLVARDAYSREALRAENNMLKTALGRHAERTLMLARVLANPGYAPYDTLIIDIGSDDGVAVDMKVFTDGDFVIGEVTKLFTKSAIVTLYSSSGSEFPVTILSTGTSSVPAIAHGVGGGSFRAVLPKGVAVRVGGVVDLANIAPEYVGVIAAITKPEGSSLQEVYFSLPVNVYTLRNVYVSVASESKSVQTQ